MNKKMGYIVAGTFIVIAFLIGIVLFALSSNEELPGDSFKEIIGGSVSVVGGGAGTIGVVAVRNARNKGFIAGLKFNDIHYRNITFSCWKDIKRTKQAPIRYYFNFCNTQTIIKTIKKSIAV